MEHSTGTGDLATWRAQARRELRLEQWAAARETLENLLRAGADDVELRLDLAEALHRLGQWPAAAAALAPVLTRPPRQVAQLLRVAERLAACNDVVAARRCLDLAERAPQLSAPLLATLARLRFGFGEMAHASALCARATAAGMQAPDVLHLQAVTLQFSGEIAAARAVLERCLARWPGFADAALARVGLDRQAADAPLLALADTQLEALRAAPAGHGTDFLRAQFEYVRFKVLDDQDRRAEAWAALARCNALMAARNPYAAAQAQARIEALVAAPLPAPDPAAARPAGPCPIFIVGMPRSGTTLLDRMLSSHPAIASAGEIDDLPRQLRAQALALPGQPRTLEAILARAGELDFAALGARYLEQTQWRAGGRAFYIDKLPTNLELVGCIRRALPWAPILHLRRDAMDTCFSNWKMFFGNASPYSYDLDALATHYLGQARLGAHWHAACPQALHAVDYAALVTDPEQVLRAVLGYCGLAFDPACLHPERNAAPVATPSHLQVRAPIHAGAGGQWRRYARELEPLRQALRAGGAAVD